MSGAASIGGPGSGTAALANALGRAGHQDADGSPTAAELVFAALGGTGFHYALVGHPLPNRVALDGGAGGLNANGQHIIAAATRLGGVPEARRWDDDDAAEAGLDAALHEGGAVMVWTDLAALPYDPLPRGYQRSLSHLVGVLGADSTDYLIDDRSAKPLPVDGYRLRLTRELAPVGGRALLYLPPAGGDRPTDLSCVLDALAEGLREHLNPPMGNRGVAGISLLAARLRDPSHPQGWRRRFGRGLAQFQAHCALFRFVEHGAGPGFGRPLLAAALRRLSKKAGYGALAEHTETWLALGSLWSALAAEALPLAVPGFGEARQLLTARTDTFLTDGLDGAGTAVSTRLAEIAHEVEASFPLSPADLAFRHADLAAQLTRLAGAERAASQRLVETIEFLRS